MLHNQYLSKQLVSYVLQVICHHFGFPVREKKKYIFWIIIYIANIVIVIRQFVKTSEDVWIDRSSRFVWTLELEVIHTFT